ncbi:Telomerase catalytic subunit/reverse transcriptase TERT [Phytophthora cinnamomi]|uniref:Telomerase catalytic subunit/reverse transcriptase TERT n=1 Tax=Phytophthora cinnamomi TaxID=4785 RepID=UPI0035594742|nr:Telomerase catalytic subunit/reverse transcriptase TERT [Phytophthora cinnamomi]
MEALQAKSSTLRSFLQSAAQERSTNGDLSLERNLSLVASPDVAFALDHTLLLQSHTSGVERFPRAPWNCDTNIAHTELVHHVIERLLVRKQAMNWEDANILTLGYREVTPGAAGHRVTQSNAIMCYYPNTLVAALKKPLWESLHQLMGDDLMTHLLLNYTIIVQLKGAPGSYMQLTGKSLRQQKQGISEACAGKAKREVSINLVMYARHFRKDRVFASSHVLVKASKTGDLISRTESSRVLGSIFPDAVGQKRLPKRLINLIPMIQSMVSRFKACKVEELAGKLIPVHSEFRKFMAENPNIKSKIAEKAAEARYSSQPILPPIVRKALDDGYFSQNEAVVGPSDERKRKRREEAIEMLSHVSVGSLKHGHDKTMHPVKKQKTADDANLTKRSTYGISDLTKLQQHKEDIKRVLTFSAPKKKIYRLVRKFVAAVVPKDIWGGRATKKNWKCVKTMLRKLIYSRKFDIFSLKKCADEFQVTNVKWMDVQPGIKFCPPNERAKRHDLFKNLLCWILSSLVFPLLRNLFYITESEGKANEIVFYQRPVWNVISTLALDDLEGAILQSSSEKALPNDHERQLSTSRLRLLPKTSGIRPLMNLSTAVEEDKVSVNRSMEAVHRVLTFEMERHPKRLLGASVRNIDEIYKRLKPLFREISSCPRCEDRRRALGDTPMAYCVSVDVERCFDTIRPRKLYQMLKKAIQEDEYLIRKHWVGHQVAPTSADSDESLPFFFKLERPACPSGELLGFDDLAGRSVKRNSMFVDGVIYDYLTKTKALQLLKEHLSANVVQIDGHDYVQRCGIPQGSVLSTTLCNLYYAHFERRVLRKRLPEVCDPAVVAVSCCQHEELCRYTDDFMYITTDLKRAQRFFDVMHEGNEEYGCFVNIAKSQANFNAADGEQHASVSSAQESDGCISWCGMLIDANNLQLYVNYEKLSSSLLQGSIPFNETKAAQEFFVNKVVSAIRQRWHALFFDPELLSPDTIHVNLFQMLVVAAHRFTILVEMMPFVNRDMHFFHECIHRILKKMSKGIHRSLELGSESVTKKSAVDRHNLRSKSSYQVQKHKVWTIGFHAFQLTIQAKREQAKACKSTSGRLKCHWQTLLDALRTEQEKFMRRATKIQGTDTAGLEWLMQDRRNASVLKQCLHLEPK